MATLDGGDSNPLEGTGKRSMRHYKLRRHKVYERECLPSERKVPSTGFKETEVDQSFERNCQVCLLFKPYFVVDFLDLLSLFIVIHMYPRFVSGESGLIWCNFNFMPSALCCDCL